jgi:hypothetical protein
MRQAATVRSSGACFVCAASGGTDSCRGRGSASVLPLAGAGDGGRRNAVLANGSR